MDPRDHLRALPDGLVCTVCHEPVPADRIRFLARRDDLTFVQVECGRCGGTALEFLTGGPGGVETSPGGSVISADDVQSMHAFLADWQGDLETLLSAPRPAIPRHEPGSGT